MHFRRTLERLLEGQELEAEEARAFLDAALAGSITEAQLAAILTAWHVKGASGPELAALASSLMERAVLVEPLSGPLVDACGTGGGTPSFNLSTAGSIVAAAAGAKVAKHGNRAVTSSCGSADVLEALGVRTSDDPAQLSRQIDEIGIGFLFAPNHHPSLRAVGPVRKQLEIRTIFNQVGPLANPAKAKRQVIGVYSPLMAEPMAEALALLGCDRGLVVHGDDGMDEVSPCAVSQGFWVESGSIRPIVLDPDRSGMPFVSSAAIAPGDTISANAELIRRALSNPESPQAAAVVPSAAAVLWVSGLVDDFAAGGVRAWDALRSGHAAEILDRLVAWESGP